MTAVVLRGDAAHLPLPDGSVDLLLCSPPYFGQRSYIDGGKHYDGQIGSEETPAEYVAALLECTRDWIRVLKPTGSLFVNLGDSYYSGKGAPGKTTTDPKNAGRTARRTTRSPLDYGLDLPRKTLIGSPWRYALGCVDDLGLTLRAEVIWNKPNGMPESAADRVRRSHEQVFHFTKQPRYFAAVDEIREPRSGYERANGAVRATPDGQRVRAMADTVNPLGRMPGSVWEIPSAPLIVPAHLGIDHFAAWPPELCRRIILGWSAPGVCIKCGEGRRPVGVAEAPRVKEWALSQVRERSWHSGGAGLGTPASDRNRVINGYACACTPHTDHPERRGKDFHAGTDRARNGMNDRNGSERYRRYVEELANPRGPVREYDFANWTPPPTRPALVVDPFGGTGTTALVADVLGRTGITVDRSMDYARLAMWRTRDPGERARALGVPKPPPVLEGQTSLFDDLEAS